MPEALLTVDEAAERLKMHPDTLRRHLRRGEIRAIKRGPRMWRIPESALEAPNIEAPAPPKEAASAKPQATAHTAPFPVPGAHLPEVPPLDLGALFAPPTPDEIARRLNALKTFDRAEEPGDADAEELDLSGNRATLYGYERDDDPTAGVRQDREERADRIMEAGR